MLSIHLAPCVNITTVCSVVSFCFNACSRATPDIHAVPKPASCRARHVALGHGTEYFVENMCFCVFCLVVAGALMHGEFCVAALHFTPG